MSVNKINQERSRSKYQVFRFKDDGAITSIAGRIPDKLKAYGELFPKDFTGKSLLDIGCDFGFWCFEAKNRGAILTVGLDRGRNESDGTHYDIIAMNQRVASNWKRYEKCLFTDFNVGQDSWIYMFGEHDVVMCCSMYHHIYAQCGDHDAIFEWLSIQVKEDGYMLWENPTDINDPVANRHIPQELKSNYTKSIILESAEKFFSKIRYVGGAIHSDTRNIYKMEI